MIFLPLERGAFAAVNMWHRTTANSTTGQDAPENYFVGCLGFAWHVHRAMIGSSGTGMTPFDWDTGHPTTYSEGRVK